MNKLTALIEAAKVATPGPHRVSMPTPEIEFAQRKFSNLANPATILELCALLEKAEEALEGSDNYMSTVCMDSPVILTEALAAIKQWKEQT